MKLKYKYYAVHTPVSYIKKKYNLKFLIILYDFIVRYCEFKVILRNNRVCVYNVHRY